MCEVKNSALIIALAKFAGASILQRFRPGRGVLCLNVDPQAYQIVPLAITVWFGRLSCGERQATTAYWPEGALGVSARCTTPIAYA
jgi:hypothetical protein